MMTNIERWLSLHGINNYSISQTDRVVDVSGSVRLARIDTGLAPVQFGHVTGTFDCSYSGITSLHGSPRSVGGDFVCHSTKITSLEGAPQFIGCSFSCGDSNITSFHDVHKQIKHIGGSFYCSHDVTHLLGLLLIDGITGFHIDRDGPIDKIFNKYVGTGDILSAQDELIDAGFIEQARL
jgi:hypothetical protein